MNYLGQEIEKILPGNVAVGGANMGMVPLFAVMWCPNRAGIWSGYVAADGQELSQNLYPDAFSGIGTGNVPTTSASNWLSDPTARGAYVEESSPGMFRVPDLNGKFPGSLGAVFLRGDGTLSAGVAGTIQQDAFQGHYHRGQSGSGSGTNWAATSAGAGTSTMTDGPIREPITDGTNGTPRTAEETRPLNVTGCWVIKMFGSVVNVGSADAAQLATDYADMVGRVAVLEGQTDFTIIYPNGGTAASPANVTTGTRYVLTNPFSGFHVVAIAQYMLSGKWTDVMMTFYSSGTYGGSCGQVGDDIVLLTGSGGLDGTSSVIGSLSNNGGTAVNTAPCRIKVWKNKGGIV